MNLRNSILCTYLYICLIYLHGCSDVINLLPCLYCKSLDDVAVNVTTYQSIIRQLYFVTLPICSMNLNFVGLTGCKMIHFGTNVGAMTS